MTEPLKQRLHHLAQRDRALQVFGAETHGYVSSPASPEQIARVEHELRVRLPAPYRSFMLEVGYGAGPFYGLWSPGQSLQEMQFLADEYKGETGGFVAPAEPFPFGTPILRGLAAKEAAGVRPCTMEHDWPCSGCIPICDQGCTFWSVLVLTGDFAGCVWDVACFAGYDGEWMPARRPPGTLHAHATLPPLRRPPTFLEWVESWLEQCEADDLVEDARQRARLPGGPEYDAGQASRLEFDV